MSDIFISYASEDQAQAARLADALDGHGWSVWWDRRLRTGSDFAAEIGRQLDAARCVIVLWSRASVTSHWVRDEAGEGQRRQILIPALIESVQPPYGFRSLQTATLVGWQGDRRAAEFLRLMADLEHLLGTTGARQQPAPRAPRLRAMLPAWASAPPRLTRIVFVMLGITLVMAWFGVPLAPDDSASLQGASSQRTLAPEPEPDPQIPDALPRSALAGNELSPDAAAAEPGATPPGQGGAALHAQTLGPFATLRRAEEIADAIRRRGDAALAFQQDDGYYVRQVTDTGKN